MLRLLNHQVYYNHNENNANKKTTIYIISVRNENLWKHKKDILTTNK